MKSQFRRYFIFFPFILLSTTTSCLTHAKGGGGAGGGMGRGMGQGPNLSQPMPDHPAQNFVQGQGIKQGQLVNLRNFLDLDDRQLQSMIDTLEKIKAMSPEEKNALRSKIDKFETLSPESQQFIRQGWGQASIQDRQAWQQMMSSLSHEEHLAIQEQMRSLSFEEKNVFRLQKIKEWREAHKAASENKDE